MDPCPFVRIEIRNLALKFPVASKPTLSAVHPTSSPCFCKIKLNDFPTQIASIPLISPDDCDHIPSSTNACFNLNKSQFDQLIKKPDCLKIEIYTGRRGYICGFNSGKLLGTVWVPLNLKGAESKSCLIKNGWVLISESSKGSSAKLNLNVKTEPDPRFVFQFDGEPECSPQVFQVNGHVRQPVFTCNFSFRNNGERNLRSRSSLSEESKSPLSWLNLLKSDQQDQPTKERKGWSIAIHDLSGSPVAAASMVTPFVPSPGTNRVSRSNPGAWLILHAGDGTWKPWGRLEAWRERGGGDHLGYRFQLLPGGDTAGMDAVTIADSNLCIKTGGKFTIDMSNIGGTTTTSSPMYSPSSSFDFGSGSGSVSISDVGSGSWAQVPYRGFVMSSTVGRRSKPEVEVGVQHVTCTEDAAAFVAVAAAIDLSVDACRLFSQKLREELRQ